MGAALSLTFRPDAEGTLRSIGLSSCRRPGSATRDENRHSEVPTHGLATPVDPDSGCRTADIPRVSNGPTPVLRHRSSNVSNGSGAEVSSSGKPSLHPPHRVAPCTKRCAACRRGSSPGKLSAAKLRRRPDDAFAADSAAGLATFILSGCLRRPSHEILPDALGSHHFADGLLFRASLECATALQHEHAGHDPEGNHAGTKFHHVSLSRCTSCGAGLEQVALATGSR